MIEAFGESMSAVVQGQPLFAFGVAFLGGLLSAANPCVLATIPLVIGYVGGYSGGDRRKAFLYSLSFILGLSVNFTLLGVAASAIGGLLGSLGVWLYVGVAVVAIVMGLSLMGLFEIPVLVKSDIRPKTRGLAGAFMMGFIFGVVSSPCATPVLAVTPDPRVKQRLALVWGVQPWGIPRARSAEDMLQMALTAVREANLARTGDAIVLTGGIPVDSRGRTNFLKLHVIE